MIDIALSPVYLAQLCFAFQLADNQEQWLFSLWVVSIWSAASWRSREICSPFPLHLLSQAAHELHVSWSWCTGKSPCHLFTQIHMKHFTSYSFTSEAWFSDGYDTGVHCTKTVHLLNKLCEPSVVLVTKLSQQVCYLTISKLYFLSSIKIFYSYGQNVRKE